MKIILQLIWDARKYRRWMLLSIIAMVAMTSAELYAPLKISALVGLVEEHAGEGFEQYRPQVHTLGITILILFIIRAIGSFGNLYFAHRVGWGALSDMRIRVYEHLQKMSLSFYHVRRTGKIMSRLTSDVSVIEELLAHASREALQGIGIIGGVAVLMYIKLDRRLALLTMIPIPFILILAVNFAHKVRSAYRKAQERQADVSGVLQDNISGMNMIQSFTREEYEAERFREESQGHYHSVMKTVWLVATRFPLVEFLGGVGTILVVWVGGMWALQGTIKINELVAFLLYLQFFYRPIRGLSQINDIAQRAVAGGTRIYELLNEEPDVKESPGAVAPKDIRHEIEFQNVNFEYRSGVPVLRDASFSVEEGSTLALVGSSGAGKSTIVSLIPRFYDPQDGRVMIGGYDVRDLKLRALRGMISMVLQEVFLFGGTVRDNILYGRLDAPFEEVVEAAKAANADEFIMSFPDGYDTIIGERGVRLSGGQRQRIAIARALLKDAPILILDEATSSVDTETEMQIREALARLTAHRTTVVIAHRLSTVLHADRIVVVENGSIAEIGTHTELMEQNGIYSRLYNFQFLPQMSNLPTSEEV